jgi:hypothetical protein
MLTLRPYQTEAAHHLARLLMDHRIAYLRGEVRKKLHNKGQVRILHSLMPIPMTTPSHIQ